VLEKNCITAFFLTGRENTYVEVTYAMDILISSVCGILLCRGQTDHLLEYDSEKRERGYYTVPKLGQICY